MIYIFPYIIKYSMNQILVTKKLYITPELKRKKKIYKVYLIISVFLIIILTSIYIYAEYDRNKSELVSQEILSEIEDNTIADQDLPKAGIKTMIALIAIVAIFGAFALIRYKNIQIK